MPYCQECVRFAYTYTINYSHWFVKCFLNIFSFHSLNCPQVYITFLRYLGQSVIPVFCSLPCSCCVGSGYVLVGGWPECIKTLLNSCVVAYGRQRYQICLKISLKCMSKTWYLCIPVTIRNMIFIYSCHY